MYIRVVSVRCSDVCERAAISCSHRCYWKPIECQARRQGSLQLIDRLYSTITGTFTIACVKETLQFLIFVSSSIEMLTKEALGAQNVLS